MGGNVTVNGKQPKPIPGAYRHEVQEIVRDLFGHTVHPSGSTQHLFDHTISIDVLDGYEFSDVDVICPLQEREGVLEQIESFEYPLKREQCIVHGHKKHGAQVSLVVEATNALNQCFQIDVEFKPFHRGLATEWAKFSQCSPREDFLAGVKGVYHKQMVMSLASLDAVIGTFVSTKRKKIVREIDTQPMYKFSVAHGLRRNVRNNGDGTFGVIHPSKATYLQDVEKIARTLFRNYDFWDQNVGDHLLSLHSICRYINDKFDSEELRIVVDEFYDRLLGEKNRINRPEAEKAKVYATVCRLLTNLPNPSVQPFVPDDSPDQP